MNKYKKLALNTVIVGIGTFSFKSACVPSCPNIYEYSVTGTIRRR